MPFVPVTLKLLRRKAWDFDAETIGDHVRKRRLELGLTQKTVARSLGVTPHSLLNWENGYLQPRSALTLHRLIQFLGYDPLPQGETIPDRLRTRRRQTGWGQRELANHLGVDRCTVTAWELGGTILKLEHRTKVANFLGLPELSLISEMADHWNISHGQ